MKLLNIICIALLTAGAASAEPIFGGPYAPDYRGDDNSIHAGWLTDSGSEPFVFETGQLNYPLFPAIPSLYYDGVISQISLINVVILGVPDKKFMRIQLGFDIPVFGQDIFVDVVGFDPEPVPGIIVGGSGNIFDVWHYIDIEMYPSPDFEEITISTPSAPFALHTIEIDTIAIPEPASLGLIGLVSGGIFFTRRIFMI